MNIFIIEHFELFYRNIFTFNYINNKFLIIVIISYRFIFRLIFPRIFGRKVSRPKYLPAI